jgi:enterochelin esterase-like enzyme
MTSKKKAAANRANSLQSTGPRTQTGKVEVSQNATKHGLRGRFHLVAGEDCAEFEEFNRSLHNQLAPCGAPFQTNPIGGRAC